MKRINATFSDKIFKKLEKYKTEEGLATFSECVHQLVESGLQKKKVDTLATNDASLRLQSTTRKSSEFIELLTILLAIQKMLENNSTWVMESRLLNRYLVENMPNQPKEIRLEILQHFKTRAGDFIRKMTKPPVSKEGDAFDEKLIRMERTR